MPIYITPQKVKMRQQGTDTFIPISAITQDNAVTTVDDTLTVSGAAADARIAGNKINEIKNSLQHICNFKSKNSIPIYTGDYLEEWRYLPSCCLKLGDYFYTFNAPLGSIAEEEHTNTGTIRKFDPINNVEITDWKKTREIGHANSCACDGTYIYVAPVADYSVETPVHPTWLYRFDMNFDPAGIENIPVSYAQGVSYDPVAQKLYFMDSSRRIWVKENGEWSLFTSVDLSNIPENEFISARRYNQDMAVYGGRYYIISPYRNIISGLMTPGTSVPDSGYTLSSVDSSFRFYLGETEGMEFDVNGHLYYTDYVNLIQDRLRNAFILEIPAGEAFSNSSPFARGEGGGYIDGTLTLTELSQNSFRLITHQIRSLSQMEVRLVRYNSSRITIPEGNTIVENYPVRMNDSLQLEINGQLQVEYFSVLNGRLELVTTLADDNVPRIITTSDAPPFQMLRVGSLTFAGENNIRISCPNYSGTNLINIGTDYGLSIFRRPPIRHESGNYFTLVGEILTGGYMYVGSARVVNNGQYATASKSGVVKVDAHGLQMLSGGVVSTYPASSADIKAGTGQYVQLVPSRQHEAAFYGLAKAAGDNTQASSNNEVGIYTNGAKSKIKEMLGIETIDVINSTNEDMSSTPASIVFVKEDNDINFGTEDFMIYSTQNGHTSHGITRENQSVVYPIAGLGSLPSAHAPRKRLMNIIKSWIGRNNFIHVTDTMSLFGADCEADSNNKYHIDCSAFICAILMGITYENSRYVRGYDAQNIVDLNGQMFSFPQSDSEKRSKGGLYTFELAKYFAARKQLFHVPKDIKIARQTLKFGDILFIAPINGTNDQYYDIEHCAFVLGTANNYVTVAECNGNLNDGTEGTPVHIARYGINTMLTKTLFARPDYTINNFDQPYKIGNNGKMILSGDILTPFTELRLSSWGDENTGEQYALPGMLIHDQSWSACQNYIPVIPGSTISYTGIIPNDNKFAIRVYQYDQMFNPLDPNDSQNGYTRTIVSSQSASNTTVVSNARYIRFGLGWLWNGSTRYKNVIFSDLFNFEITITPPTT